MALHHANQSLRSAEERRGAFQIGLGIVSGRRPLQVQAIFGGLLAG